VAGEVGRHAKFLKRFVELGRRKKKREGSDAAFVSSSEKKREGKGRRYGAISKLEHIYSILLRCARKGEKKKVGLLTAQPHAEGGRGKGGKRGRAYLDSIAPRRKKEKESTFSVRPEKKGEKGKGGGDVKQRRVLCILSMACSGNNARGGEKREKRRKNRNSRNQVKEKKKGSSFCRLQFLSTDNISLGKKKKGCTRTIEVSRKGGEKKGKGWNSLRTHLCQIRVWEWEGKGEKKETKLSSLTSKKKKK